MCGIAGIVGGAQRQQMEAMLQKQRHRGPDFTGQYVDEGFAILGHNRLAIIDLSTEANQPFIDASGRYAMVFNGEIYNYAALKGQLPDYNFRTQSDTEVLLAAYIKWGKDALEKCNGMFSFAIWDKKEKKLFAARDRFGVKPFYYAFCDGQFYFSSEIKALFAAGIKKNKNEKVWANYFTYGSYGLPNESFWDGIEQLPSGHYLHIDFSNDFNKQMCRPQLWYDFQKRIAQTPQLLEPALKEQYEILLHDAIKLRFQADVSIGMNVSGGLDSSTLIALVHENLSSDKKIEAFTFYTGNSDYDELLWVNALMQTTPYALNIVLLETKEVPQLIGEISYFEDEPFGGFPTLAYSLLFKKARENGIKVLLDGQGMDEAWAGYDYYHNASGNIIQGVNTSPVRPEILNDEFRQKAQKEIYPEPFESKLQNLQYRDLFFTKMPRALRFNDRISMMHGTELREPFLDYRLVELAFAQSDAMKIQNGQTKWLLRNLVREKLGDSIALAPKRPLQTPQREWIANELKSYFEEQIHLFSNLDFVNKKQVLSIWVDYCNGNQDNSFYIWQWVNCLILEDT